MKKWMAVMGAGAIAAGLSACQETQAPTTGGGSETPPQETPEEIPEDTQNAAEIYEKAVSAAQQTESVRAQSVTDQHMKLLPDGMEIDMNIQSDLDMTYEPLAFHQTGETSIASDDIDNTNPMLSEMYLTDQGLYMHETSVDMWLKMPEEMHEDMMALVGQQSADPSRQLEELGDFREEFVLEDTGDAYILTLDASGEQFQELMDEQLQKTLGQMEMEVPLSPEDLTVHSVQYVITLDKESYLTSRMDIDTNLDVDVSGQTMAIESQMRVDYSDYDAIGPIEIPPEVLEQAQEIEY